METIPLEALSASCLYKDKDIDHLRKEIEQDNSFSLLKNYYSNSDTFQASFNHLTVYSLVYGQENQVVCRGVTGFDSSLLLRQIARADVGNSHG
jgi:hypothetical protein